MSVIPVKFTQLIIYVTSILFTAGVVLFGDEISNSIFSLLIPLVLIAVSALSKADFGIYKIINTRITTISWCIGSILLAFLPYLLNFYANLASFVWICAAVSVVNLVVIFFTKLGLQDNQEV